MPESAISLDQIYNILHRAPSRGTIGSLFAELQPEQATSAYSCLMGAISDGLLPHVTVLGAMCKMSREYHINNSSFVSPLLSQIEPLNAKCNPELYSGLKAEHILTFVQDGILHLPAIVDEILIDECLRVLNRQLGTPGAVVAGGAQKGLGKLQGSISQHASVRALVNPAVRDVVNSLIVDCDMDNLTAQLALRFPQVELSGEREALLAGRDWHTDGLRKGKLHPFSILLGIALSDVQEPWHGNLVVWKGTHRLIHRCLQGENGAVDCEQMQALLNNTTELADFDHRHSAVPTMHSDDSNCTDTVECVDPCEQIHDNEPSNLPALGTPVQVCLRKGDIVLLHPDLAHTGGPNYGPHIRYILYFRLKARNLSHSSHLENMWCDFTKDVRVQGMDLTHA